MSMNQFGAGFVLSAVDKASPVVNKLGATMSKFFQKKRDEAGGLMKALGLAALGYGMQKVGRGISGYIDEAAKDAGTIGKTVRTITALRGLNAEQAEAIRARVSAKDVAQLGFSGDQAAEALMSMAQTGHDAEESMSALGTALQLAKLSGLGAAEAAGALDDITDVYGGTIDKTQDKVDKIAWSMKRFGVEGGALTRMMTITASSAKLINASFEDTLMSVAMVQSVIPSPMRAAAAINTAFNQLASKPLQQKLKALGVDVLDAEGKFAGLNTVIGGVAKATAGLTEGARATKIRDLFGGRAAGGVSVIFDILDKGVKDAEGNLLKGADAMAFLEAQMQDSGGSAEKMAKELTSASERVAGGQDRINKSFSTAAASLMKPVYEAWANILEKVGDFMQSLPPEVRETLVGIAKGFGQILILGGSILLFATIMDRLGLSFTGMLWSATKFILIAAPLTVALVGMGIGLYGVHQRMDKTGKGFQGFFDRAKVGWQGMVELISKRSLSDATKKAIGGADMGGVRDFLNWVDRMLVKWDAFWTGIVTGWDQGLARLDPYINRFMAKFGLMTSVFSKDNTPEELAKIENAGIKAGYGLTDLAIMGIEAMTGLIDIFQSVKESMEGITFEDIKDGMRSFVRVAKNVWNVLDAIAVIFDSIYHTVAFIVDLIVTAFLGIAETLANVFGFFSGLSKVGTAKGLQAMGKNPAAAESFLQQGKDEWSKMGYKNTKNWGKSTSEQLVHAYGGETGDERMARGDREDQMIAQRQEDEWVARLADLKEEAATANRLVSKSQGQTPEQRARLEGWTQEWMGKMQQTIDAINMRHEQPVIAQVKFSEVGDAVRRALGDDAGRQFNNPEAASGAY